MNTPIFGEAILVTLGVGGSILENAMKREEPHLHTHHHVQSSLPNSSLGINPYNIYKIPLSIKSTTARLVTLETHNYITKDVGVDTNINFEF